MQDEGVEWQGLKIWGTPWQPWFFNWAFNGRPDELKSKWALIPDDTTIADTLEKWFTEGAADGFNIMPPYFHEGFDDFVDLVVPELQQRGLFRRDYEGTTLRDHFGLARVPAPVLREQAVAGG